MKVLSIPSLMKELVIATTNFTLKLRLVERSIFPFILIIVLAGNKI